MKTDIEIDGKAYEIDGGLVSSHRIYELVESEDAGLFLNQADEIDIPIDLECFLVIKGNESFVTGESSIEDNPPLRNGVNLRFNGESGLKIERAKITGKELKGFDSEHSSGRLFIDIGIGPDVEIVDGMKILVQQGNAFFVIPASEGSDVGDPVDLEDCSQHDRPPPKGHQYRIRIDREKYVVKQEKITGKEILALVGKTTDMWSLNQKLSGGKRERIKSDDTVDLTKPGIERFETVRRQAQQGSE